eukprot:TRINITY_DN14127_c0_g1_i1.p1 TRINITY_DN14127_c0_g1~~TRINITY_DN14127_c0_g1_i1.p1  ORF type:complete len:436 (-),score=84.74 TRINITY_DN14127_c0_g1_i1:261-1568(-)
MSDAASVNNASAADAASERAGTFGSTAPWSYDGHRHPPPDVNHLCFPPRGQNRPTLRQVLSEPTIRREFLCQTELHAQDRYNAEPERYHQGLEDLFSQLDSGKASLAKQRKREAEARRNQSKIELEQQRQIASESVGHERTPWAFTDKCVLDYFNNQAELLDKDISRTNNKNDMLQGIFDVKDDFYKACHPEFNVHKTWNNFRTNERGTDRGQSPIFGVKDEGGPDRPSKLSPTELPIRKRLEKTVARMTDEIHRDALAATDGCLRKTKIEKAAPEFSCLKRQKAPWTSHKDPKLGYFSSPEPYVPADHPYTTMLPKYVQQSDRAVSPMRDFIAGDSGRTSFWKAPKTGYQGGTTNYQRHAQEITTPNGVKHMLKWAGSKSNPQIDLSKVPGQLKKSVSGHLMRGSGGGSPCHKATAGARTVGSWRPVPRVAGAF